MKVNQRETYDITAKVQMNTDMVAELCQEKEMVKYYLDNILLIGALKGYKVTQLTEEYTFWTNHTITMDSEQSRFHIQFAMKKNKFHGFEIRIFRDLLLHNILLQYLGDSIFGLFGDKLVFTYEQEKKMLLLKKVHDFIVEY